MVEVDPRERLLDALGPLTDSAIDRRFLRWGLARKSLSTDNRLCLT
jgi:hypothetical protein